MLQSADIVICILAALCLGFFLGSACIYIAFAGKRKAERIIQRLRDAQHGTYATREDEMEYFRRTRV